MDISKKIVSSNLARIVLQQCVKAKLEVKPSSSDVPAEYVEIGKGVIVYVSFFKDSTEECIDKIVKSILNVKLTECPDGKHHSVIESNCDILIIPQASLAGKLKGNCVQYHNLTSKSSGETLFSELVKICTNELKCINAQNTIKHGTYGNRQVLNIETNGPFTHVFDF